MIRHICRHWKTFVDEEDGATATEYAILLAFVAIFTLSAILATGDVQKALWFATADKLEVISGP